MLPSLATTLEPLRVAYLSPGWPPSSFANGIVSYVANVRRALPAVGIDSRVIAAQIAGADPMALALSDPALHPSLYLRLMFRLYERLQGSHAIELRFGHAVARAHDALARAWCPDLIEVEESFGLAAFTAPLIHSPVVVRLHGPWCLVAGALGLPPDAAYHHRVRWEARALRAAAGVSSPSRHVLALAREAMHLPLPISAVIPNPAPQVPPAERWRAQACEPERILFVGRFDRIKGADVLLAAFARLAERRPRLTLTIVGPDRGLLDDDGRTWSVPDYLAAHLPAPVAARVTWAGELPSQEVPPLRRRAAITVVPSRFETFSMTTLEALGHGSPLVVTAVGGLPEMVRDGANGLLVPPGDAPALAAAWERLLDDPALAERLGAQGARDAETHFSVEVVARRTRAFYDEVLISRARSGARRAG